MRAHHHQAISRQLQTDKEILLRSRMWCGCACGRGGRQPLQSIPAAAAVLWRLVGHFRGESTITNGLHQILFFCLLQACATDGRLRSYHKLEATTVVVGSRWTGLGLGWGPGDGGAARRGCRDDDALDGAFRGGSRRSVSGGCSHVPLPCRAPAARRRGPGSQRRGQPRAH